MYKDPIFTRHDFCLSVGDVSSTVEEGWIEDEDVAAEPNGNCPLFDFLILCQFIASIAALAAAVAAFAAAVCSIAN
jgi:hypothetical protein